MSNPSVNIARLVYLLICQLAGVAIALSTNGTPVEFSVTTGLLVGLGVGGFFIGVEKLIEGFTLRGFSTATFGLGIGLFCAWLLTRVEISNLLELAFHEKIATSQDGQTWVSAMRLAIDVTLFASLGFLGAALALRGNREDFAFIIPYVRFRQDSVSGQPVVIDAEAIMDGRFIGLAESGFVRGRLIIPDYILEIIRSAAQEENGSTQLLAQRGLENMEQIQKNKSIKISFHESRNSPDKMQSKDLRLIETCRLFGARLLTTDSNLTKIAKLQSVSVINLNELDMALRPSAAVGDRIQVALVRTGKDPHQAIGYLTDGTMIVVNEAEEKIGEIVDVTIISLLKTATGVMAFAELIER